jgi:hypothetical protein
MLGSGLYAFENIAVTLEWNPGPRFDHMVLPVLLESPVAGQDFVCLVSQKKES